ncbi:helix-turn-helix domain-containing protein [Natronomonas sp. F2-12]|uniref:Helix-turn-helix domain-containing protein n=1 Tax=Natronomonas aquatica TaxID=2841590 RepID=A0A9R1CS95_9EURY|nr:helix-turn-helix domain-containing protein [Natronomonas aquatica]MCQ4333032.1 helix-turn-helix domain-containing protein [Natronomonas aquatica]
MSLLPSTPEISADSEPRVVGLDSEEADDLMAALSSGTARQVLSELHEEPAPPGELADRVDTSLQNAQYHLEKLEAAGAVEVVGTAYSEKGREMSVYGPADSPLVIFAGEEERASGLKSAISRLFGGFLALAVGAVAVQTLFGDTAEETAVRTDGDGGGGDAGALETVEDEAADAPASGGEGPVSELLDAVDAIVEGLFGAGVPPGLAFFLGGAIVLTVLIATPYVRAWIRTRR